MRNFIHSIADKLNENRNTFHIQIKLYINLNHRVEKLQLHLLSDQLIKLKRQIIKYRS